MKDWLEYANKCGFKTEPQDYTDILAMFMEFCDRRNLIHAIITSKELIVLTIFQDGKIIFKEVAGRHKPVSEMMRFFVCNIEEEGDNIIPFPSRR